MMAGSTTKQTSKTSAGGKDTKDQSPDLGAAATEVKDQIQGQVGGLTDQVRQQATDQISSQKDRLVETMESVALLLHQAGEHATKDDKAMLAGYVDKASEQVTRWSESLRDQDATQLVESTKDLARRQPLLFFTGALAAGFVGSRFFRSSAQQIGQTPDDASSSSTEQQAPENDDSMSQDEDGTSGFNDSALDMPLPSDLALESEITPEIGGYLEDVEGTPSDADEFDITTMVDLDDLTRPEKR